MSPITVNGVSISADAIRDETAHHRAATPEQAEQAAATALVLRELLRQEALRLGIEAADEDAAVDALIAREVQVPAADEDTCRRFFEANRDFFRTPALYEVDHILFAAAPGVTPDREAARSAAQSVLAELQTAPDRFAELARTHSACPSKEQGGNLGQIGPGQTVPEFEQALEQIPAGSIGTEPVETRFGFHLIRVNRAYPRRPLPFESVQKKIGEYLESSVRQTGVRQYLGILIGRATITGIDLGAGDGSPLVQ